jgi:mono/diheme cytochrome c family protein
MTTMPMPTPTRRSTRPASALAGCLFALSFVASCGETGPGSTAEGEGLLAERLSWSGLEAPAPPPATPELLARGEEVFRENCGSCHGEAGDGNGVCAPFLLPHPRDFTSGIFRFKSTPDGAMPTDRDLYKTVSAGLHGTGMPPWMFLLDEQDRWAVVHHVKSFSDAFERAEEVEPVELGPAPEATPKRIERGAKLYTEGGCGQCHGPHGYGDGPSAQTLVDSFGNPISPRNFHKIGQFKRGYTLRDIALTIHTGNNGTPMPSFGMAFDEEQIWDLAAFILSLGERKLSGGGEPARADMGGHLGEPDVVIALRERYWKFVPDEIRVQQGQIVRIDFQPTDNGLGAGHGFAIDGYDKSAFINGALVQRPKSVTFLADKAGTFTFYCASQCSTGSLHPNMNGTLIVEPAGS